MSSLPNHTGVSIPTLLRIFSNTTNSYKLVFFRAILNLLPKANQKNGPVILSLNELAVEAAAISWYPIKFYHLSFGSQDILGRIISQLDFYVDDRNIGHRSTQLALRRAINDQSSAIGLGQILDYVPFRLLQPFFSNNLRGLLDSAKNRKTSEYAEAEFHSVKPLYRFVSIGGKDFIELHPIWNQYFMEWREIIIGWVTYKWIEFLQYRNPNVPAIPNKIESPLNRRSLKNQTRYWLAVMRNTPVRCVYSGELLNEDNFSLDHFLPWSFVCHDQLWNLFPVFSRANSSKGSSLPSEKYIACFIDLQIAGLRIASGELPEKQWARMTADFVSDLHIVEKELLTPTVVRSAYEATVPAMLSLAEQTGFSPQWSYR